MAPWLIGAAVVISLASRPLARRLWARGMVSDRTAAALLLGRTPLFAAATALILGVPVHLVVVIVVVSAIPALFFYPITLRGLRERASKAPGSTDHLE